MNPYRQLLTNAAREAQAANDAYAQATPATAQELLDSLNWARCMLNTARDIFYSWDAEHLDAQEVAR